jgi:hypothetical protein
MRGYWPRGMTMTGASVPARMRADVEPRNTRLGAATRLDPTTRTSRRLSASVWLAADTSETKRIGSPAALANVSVNGKGLSSPARVGTTAVSEVMTWPRRFRRAPRR